MIWRPPNYDPQACGAKCDQCFLRVAGASRPVPAEWHVDDRGRFTDKIAVVGEAPGENEEAEMRPFVGDSGILITDALQRAGINRNQMLITNAVLCRPEKNDFSAMQRKLKKVNADRLKAGLAPLLDPLDACSERLRREISGFAHIIPAGNRAVQAVAGNVETITRLRGAMMDGWLIGTDDGPRYFPAEDVYATVAPNLGDTQHRAKLLPSLHPAFVLRSKRWMKAFYSDLMRAVAWFEGRIEYQEPTLVFKPSPAELRAFLATLHIGACDVETDALEPMLAKLRCIGFGNADTAYVVPRHSVDGQTIYYSDAEWAEIVTIIRDWLRDPNKVKVGHNFGYYDRMVIERYFNCIPITVIDTVLVHRLIEPELPHNLAYVVSMYTAISPAWKSAHTATTARSDLELGKYNGNDNVLDFRALGPMWAQLEARDQVSLLAHDAHSQAVCVEMHQVGMYVDQNRRLEHEYRYGLEGWMWRQRILDVVEKPGFNPQSVPQVREFMFQTLQLPIPDAIVPDKHGREKLKPMLTGSGDPSTSDDAIRALLVHPQVRRNKRAVAFLLALRRYRAAMKLLGTYIVKLRPQSEFADVGIDLEDVNDVVGDSLWDFDSNGFIDEYEISARAKAERKRVKARKRGIVWPDGRIHPDYNAHGPVTGRKSSSNPNSQNFPAIIRDMIIAAAGHVLIGADQEQLELRILAALYGLEKYLEALDRGADPHATTALGAFPDSDAESAFRRVAGFPSGGFWDGDFFFNPNGGKWAGLAKMCRDLAKRIQYAGQYWATVETIFRVIQSAEDEMGNLIYPNLTLPQVRMRYDNWRGYVPEIERGWEGDLATYRRQGYLREPVLGRRRDFLDGENKNEIVNFRVQAAGAALILLIEERCRSQIPAFYAGEGTGQINNGHDALFFEVPENDADRVCAIVDEAFNIEHPALPRVKFTGKAEKGRTWKSVC